MADHGQLVIERTAAMNITVASAHRSQFRTEIGPRHVDERFAERRAPGLVADQRRKDVAFAFVQKHSASGADRFLTAAEINAADDHSAPVHGSEFLLKNP